VKIVTVARKPILGSATQNVIDHGCGALNIDGCRTNTPPRATGTKTSGDGQNRGPDAKLRQGSGRDSQRAYDDNLPSGRWPANLILQHRPGCALTGTVPDTYQINRWTDGAKPFGGGAGHEYEGEEQVGTVEVWECVEGCSVKGLGDQSGILTTGTFKQRGQSSRSKQPGGWRTGPREHKDFVGDSGTAARYFKQVKEHE
jgi:hypothetical protein